LLLLLLLLVMLLASMLLVVRHGGGCRRRLLLVLRLVWRWHGVQSKATPSVHCQRVCSACLGGDTRRPAVVLIRLLEQVRKMLRSSCCRHMPRLAACRRKLLQPWLRGCHIGSWLAVCR
jgi:hypothetical protein